MLLFLCFGTIKVSAHDTSTVTPLVEVLREQQARFGYRFNYASETVEGIRVDPPFKGNTFKEALDCIEEYTGLNFTLFEGKLVGIKKHQWRFCGYLKDKNGNEPISNASVYAGTSSTITDEAEFNALSTGWEGIATGNSISIAINIPNLGEFNDTWNLHEVRQSGGERKVDLRFGEDHRLRFKSNCIDNGG
jgi:hypothetical protein